MFDSISEKLAGVLDGLRGTGRMTEENVTEAVREVRIALLEADVSLPVINHFVEEVQKNALGTKVLQSLTPGQAFIGVVRDELTRIMGAAKSDLNLRGNPPVAIMVCGLQGSGKTTSVAKMALYAKKKLKQNPLLVSCDIHRPAAIEQLATLADQIKVPYLVSGEMGSAVERVRQAQVEAKARLADILFIDTAGRTTLNEELMQEIQDIYRTAQPIEVLFVADAMLGQSAVSVAEAFGNSLPLTGLVLTKLDGDMRGGAALSAHAATGAPIKFVGVGEKLEDLEQFHPDRMAARILGMGDVLTLVEHAQSKVDLKKAKSFESRLRKGGAKSFNLEDYREQLEQADKIGGMEFLLNKLPQRLSQGLAHADFKDNRLARHKAIIQSMTPTERRAPKTIKASHRQRIARGSGVDVQQVNEVLRNFEQTQKMVKRFAKNPAGMMRMLQNMFG
jgi:signal recognition particle subunit SRP54